MKFNYLGISYYKLPNIKNRNKTLVNMHMSSQNRILVGKKL